MGLAFCDGFDSYGLATDLSKKWQTVQAPWKWVAGAGRFGGGCIQSDGSATGKVLATSGILTTQNNAAGFWVRFSGIPTSTNQAFMVCVDGTGAIGQDWLWLNSSGLIGIGIPFNAAVTTAPKFVCDNIYHWVEWSTIGGQRTLFIDNIQQFTFGDAHANAPASWGFQSVSGITMTIDDAILYDSTTGNPTPATNYPLSSRQITTLRPVSDGVCNFGTLSSGTAHFSLVNEVNPDGDTSYCEDGTSGHQDLFNMSSLGFTPAGITTVMANAYMETGVPGTISNQLVCKSGATTSPSGSAVTSNSYSTRQASFPVDPNTSAAWVPSALAAAQFGYKCP